MSLSTLPIASFQLWFSSRLVIHCGVGHMTADRFTLKEQAQYHAGLQKTLLVANEVLAKGSTATDAVMVAIN